MIKREDLVEIGKFQRTHALKGELNALLDVEKDYVEDGMPLIVEMDGIFVPFYADSIRPKGAESYLIKLKEIDSQEKAREFVNKSVYGLRADLLNYFDNPDEELRGDFIGFTIKDSSMGVVGKIEDIDDSTDNVLFIVRNEEGKTVYIPVADEFINAIDEESQIIETSLPEGLIDLND